MSWWSRPAFIRFEHVEQSNIKNGRDYPVGTLEEFLNLVQSPLTCSKDNAPACIFSSYNASDARSHQVQAQQGSFSALWVDVDETNHSHAQVVEKMQRRFPNTFWVVYHSASAAPGYEKHRIVIPLQDPTQGEDWYVMQLALYDVLIADGFTLDYVACRPAQITYLPLRGALYEHTFNGAGVPLTTELDAQVTAVRAERAEKAAQARPTSGFRPTAMCAPYEAFAWKHPTAEVLRYCGFETMNGRDWKHSAQSNGSYATRLMDDGSIYTLSDTVGSWGGVPVQYGGHYFASGFALFRFFNRWTEEQGAAYAAQCMKEYVQPFADHGRKLWEGIVQRAAQAEERRRQEVERAVEEARKRIPKEDARFEWKLDWPPGLVGDIARWVYGASRRPVKQFAIVQALYGMSALAGGRYAVSGTGVNLYFMLVGESGVGKGESQRAREALFRAAFVEARTGTTYHPLFANKVPASEQGLMKMFNGAGVSRAIYENDGDSVLKRMAGQSGASPGLRRGFTEVWDKSGPDQETGSIFYAKDEDKIDSAASPSLCMCIDTQLKYYKAFIGDQEMAQGLMQRFLYAVFAGTEQLATVFKTPPLPQLLVERLADCWLNIQARPQGDFMPVALPACTPEWEVEVHNEALSFCKKHSLSNYMNRISMNAQRIAAVLAIADNPNEPVITEEHLQYAAAFVKESTAHLRQAFVHGDTGSGESVRTAKAVEALKLYVLMEPGRRLATWDVPKSIVERSDVVPMSYFLKKLRRVGDFKGTDQGRTTQDHIRSTVKDLVSEGYLKPMSDAEKNAGSILNSGASITQEVFHINVEVLDLT